MSGNKTMTVTAGVLPVAELGDLIGAPLQAYQERQRRERAAAMQREVAIQQRISQIRASIGSRVSESKAVVQLQKIKASIQNVVAKDIQNQLEDLKSRLPKIKAEYLALTDKQVMDAQTVRQAIERVEQALSTHDLATAETYLQALDDERIQQMQQLQAQWTAQIEYLQERLDGLRAQLPQALIQDLRSRINHAHANWLQLAETDLQQIHSELSDLETQAEQIQEAALNLVNSWMEVGYDARILGVDNGDVVI
ncbi:MAG: hypothetical protein HC862_24255 [Scytonema sp. RU_4_4]|nr:hypothetical protein [Scytonema sp. RU_4_4]